jgi:hypothetical protein
MENRMTRDARQRNAAASARNARPIVEQAESQVSTPMDRHWQAIARTLFEQGHEERDVMAALRQRNCKTFVAADAIKATRHHYRNVHHMAHRKAGLKALVAGAAFCTAGAAIFLLGMGHLFYLGGSMFVSGLAPLVFGLYKALTGSTVPLVLPEDQR